MSKKRFRAAGMLLVFTMSAVVHEYILAICFGFFYPVLFCLFMCFGSKTLPSLQYNRHNIKTEVFFWLPILTAHLLYCAVHLAVMFNFILHDRRKGPIWNVIMWTALFLGQGVIICLYSQEWYAQRYCPLQEVYTTAHLGKTFILGSYFIAVQIKESKYFKQLRCNLRFNQVFTCHVFFVLFLALFPRAAEAAFLELSPPDQPSSRLLRGCDWHHIELLNRQHSPIYWMCLGRAQPPVSFKPFYFLFYLIFFLLH